MTRVDAAGVRRYLLGTSDENEMTTLERRYFEDPDALDEVAAIEDDLIEDYLAGRLEPAQYGQFERHYLATPRHRTRVETIRRLLADNRSIATSPSASRGTRPRPFDTAQGRRFDTAQGRPVDRAQGSFWRPSLAAAAALLIVAAGTAWLYRPSSSSPASPPAASVSAPPAAGPSASRPTEAPVRRVFAFSLPPVTVRSGDDRSILVIPDDVEFVSLDLQQDDGSARPTSARGVIRTTDGDEIWIGPASVAANLPAGVVARLEIPADRLPADDYIVSLIADRQGREDEEHQYFLRVRQR